MSIFGESTVIVPDFTFSVRGSFCNSFLFNLIVARFGASVFPHTETVKSGTYLTSNQRKYSTCTVVFCI